MENLEILWELKHHPSESNSAIHHINLLTPIPPPNSLDESSSSGAKACSAGQLNMHYFLFYLIWSTVFVLVGVEQGHVASRVII